jgi:glyoxylase-like metal-dependent hydrolase (beta-lactamase superfamily II)
MDQSTPSQIDKNLYQLKIELPRNPLKVLNSYVMTSGDRNLVVDTGFNLPECLVSLRQGLEALDLDLSRTDFLATHLHADHTGLISTVMSPTSRVYMGRVDKALFEKTTTGLGGFWQAAELRFAREGYSQRELDETRRMNPARNFASSYVPGILPLDEGDTVAVGDMRWTVVETPGHTPGHICLYESSKKFLLTGDHLLFDITPNITCWEGVTDSLGDYLESLRKIRRYEADQVLPAHRGIEGSLQKRVDELLVHHANRLEDVLRIVRAHPHSTGYEIASHMPWSIRAASWADFPPGQRWFAVGETIAHIEHLVLGGKLLREERNGVNTYEVAE